jgi:hypothetical protein
MENITFVYEIKVEGLIDDLWAEWFNGMAITYVNNVETILAGELRDQSALHGVLERIRDLGLNLISVRRVDGDQLSHTAMVDEK